MTKTPFDQFHIERAENGFLIVAEYPDPEAPPMLYIASSASKMIELLSGFVGIETKPRTATIVEMKVKP